MKLLRAGWVWLKNWVLDLWVPLVAGWIGTWMGLQAIEPFRSTPILFFMLIFFSGLSAALIAFALEAIFTRIEESS